MDGESNSRGSRSKRISNPDKVKKEKALKSPKPQAQVPVESPAPRRNSIQTGKLNKNVEAPVDNELDKGKSKKGKDGKAKNARRHEKSTSTKNGYVASGDMIQEIGVDANICEDDIVVDPTPVPNPEVLSAEILCKDLIEELRSEAWEICMERFYKKNDSQIIGAELRDTWIRIIEMNFMDGIVADLDDTETTNHYFTAVKRDQASQIDDDGAKDSLQELPQERKESVRDPPPIIMDIPQRFSKVGGSDGDNMMQNRTSQLIEQWVRENDPEASTNQNPIINSKGSLLHTEVDEILRTRNASSFEQEILPLNTVKELEFIKEAINLSSVKSSHSGLEPWVISTCGAQDGSGGIYKLINQTTDEALHEAEKLKSNLSESALLENTSACEIGIQTLYDGDETLEVDSATTLMDATTDTVEDSRNNFMGSTSNEYAKQIKRMKQVLAKLGGRKQDDMEEMLLEDPPKLEPVVDKKSNNKTKTKDKYKYGNRVKSTRKTKKKPTTPVVVSKMEQKPVIVERPPFVCVIPEIPNDELTTGKLAIIKLRQGMIQNQRNELRKKLSTQKT